jgi:hypothetical protein
MKVVILVSAWMAGALLGCSSSTTTRGGSGGTGGGATGGAGGIEAGIDGGATCTTVTGTYSLTGTRDTNNPGSCPGTLKYADGATVTLTKNGADYALAFESPLYASSCSVNVTGCVLNATCVMSGRLGGTSSYDSNWQGEILWTITQQNATGTDHWTNFSSVTQTTKCSANWLVTATRQ